MLHEYMIREQMELQQKRLDWVNRNAWMFNKEPKRKKAQKQTPTLSKEQTFTCCA